MLVTVILYAVTIDSLLFCHAHVLDECFCACKLLACGDVEENPGPTVEDMFQTLLEGQQAIRADIAGLKARLEITESTVTSLGGRLSNTEAKVNEIQTEASETEHLSARVAGRRPETATWKTG